MTNEIININDIIDLIPHRYPILLVDRLIEFEIRKSATGIKNVTFNEPHFMGHFPKKSVMPGVLIVEALAQTSAILTAKSINETESKDKLVYFMSIDNAKFRKPVIPGDQLYLKVNVVQNRGAVWKFNGVALVDNKVVAEAKFTAMVLDKDKV